MTLGLAVTFDVFQNRFRVFKVSSTDTNSGVHQNVILGCLTTRHHLIFSLL